MSSREIFKVLVRWVDLGQGRATWSWVSFYRARELRTVDGIEQLVTVEGRDRVGRIAPELGFNARTLPRFIRAHLAAELGIPRSRVEVLRG